MRRRRERWGRRCRRWGESRPRRSPHRRPRRRPSPVRGGRLCRSVGQHRPAPDPAGRPAPSPSAHPAHAAVSSASTASPDLLVLDDAPPAAGPAQPFVRVRGTPRGSPATGPLRVRCRTRPLAQAPHGRGHPPRPWARPGPGVTPSSAVEAAWPRRHAVLGLRRGQTPASHRSRPPKPPGRPPPTRPGPGPPAPPDPPLLGASASSPVRPAPPAPAGVPVSGRVSRSPS